MDVAPEIKSRVMRALLRIGDGVLMLSDDMLGMPGTTESNVHVCLDFDDSDDMTKKFQALAVGGRITMPLNDTFCGAKLGMVTNAYHC